MCERRDSVKQNGNSGFQEHITEASLISSAGLSRERQGKSRCLFSVARPRTGLTPSGVRGSAGRPPAESWRGSRMEKIVNLVVSEPLRDSAAVSQRKFGRRGFRSVPVPREGGRVS